MAACLDINDNVKRIQHAVALSVHTIFRPKGDDILPRKNPLSEKKLQGEGAPSEQKTVLGWDINARRFRVRLPVYKYIAWSNDVKQLMKIRSTTYDTIKSILGRLTHTATIFYPGRFFLDRIWALEPRCEKFGQQKISTEELKDLELWTNFLEHITTTGVSINNITFTNYDIICWSDASEHGLGGYTSTGLAFSYAIPEHFQGLLHITLLEFLAAHWIIHIALDNSDFPFCRIAHLADNTSALAWMRKSAFNTTKQPVHNQLARNFATMLMENEATLSSVHKAGKHNIVADILSRDTHLSPDQLSIVISNIFPTQIHQSLQYVDLTTSITSA